MGALEIFDPQRGFVQTLSAILCVTLAWTPYGASWADAIQAAGRDGQQLGQQVLGGFAFPIDNGTGSLTLNPGTAQESAISIGTLFPDTNSTSTTTSDFANLYGNNPGTLAAGLNAQTALNGETSFTGEAYRTLIDNAHQSHPDLQADPIWQNGDHLFSDFTPWAQSFSDCTTTTTQTETQQSVRVPDYQLCLRQPTVPQSCTATHQVNVSH